MTEIEKKISIREAFDAMKMFLEEFYNQTQSDDVGSLLGDLQFSSDNNTMGPAAWHDWVNCVKKVKKHKVNILPGSEKAIKLRKLISINAIM